MRRLLLGAAVAVLVLPFSVSTAAILTGVTGELLGSTGAEMPTAFWWELAALAAALELATLTLLHHLTRPPR